jgi:sugar phosphate isomerase/epimerase
MLHKHASAIAAVTLTAAVFCPPAHSHQIPTSRLITDHFVFNAPSSVADAELAAVAERAESVFDAVERFLGGVTGVPRIRYTVFPTLEDKGLATGYTLPAHALSGTGAVFAALEPGFEGEADRALAGLLIRKVLGEPKTGLLESGLAMYFTEDWRGRGYRYWAARVGAVDGAADLETLLDNGRLGKESDLIVRPLAGAFVSWAVEAFGRESLLEKYSTWEPAAGEIESMDPGWRQYLGRLNRELAQPPAGGGDGSDARPAFLKGFCHAHEGYQVHNGYISRRSDAALEKLAALGVNSVSLSPFTYMRNPRTAEPLPYSKQTGAENDESVIHAAVTAKRLGMSVMVKPHIWLRGSWPGEVEMDGEEAWDRFFDYYWRWIRHYAVLAEMYDVELLCVGVELSRSTLGHEARWRSLFDRVRQIYRGRITYAANWGEEIENVSFWDALDFVGVNCYYPLSVDRRPTDEQLRDGVERALDRIEEVGRRYGKRVIITEVGFTSSPAPWVRPYERQWRATPNEEAQARCYRAFFEGLADRTRYAGVYWWKWPSFLEYGGPRHSGYTPNGKSAERVVREWFGADTPRRTGD